MVATAYNVLDTRIIFPPDLLTNRFDLLLTMPGDWKQLLQEEIKKRFGLVARSENREVDVFRLRVNNQNPPNLKPHAGRNQNSSSTGSQYTATIQNQSLFGFLINIEYAMGQPVIDETGLRGRYDLQINWRPNPGESTQDAFRRALLQQLGLELVPDRATIEELVVEKEN